MREIVRNRILEKCGYKCCECESPHNLEVDHIIPLSRGGKHDEDNMQILCRTCNRKKGKSVDFNKYFKIGESLEYIEIHTDIYRILTHGGQSIFNEFKKWIEMKFDENNALME